MPLIIASAATRPNASRHVDGTSRIRVKRKEVRRPRRRRRGHDLRVLAEIEAGKGVQTAGASRRLDHQDRNVGTARSQHVRQTREQQRPFVRGRVHEGHEPPHLVRRLDV